MSAMTHMIKIKLGLPEGKVLSALSGGELAESMEGELGSFEEWFTGQGNAPLVGVESAILRTFLAWKLRYEEQ